MYNYILFVLQKKNLLKSCLSLKGFRFRCLKTNEDEEEDDEKVEAKGVPKVVEDD